MRKHGLKSATKKTQLLAAAIPTGVTITDTVTNISATQTYIVDLAGILGTGNAYVGFTGGSGGLTAVQDILSWTYGPKPV